MNFSIFAIVLGIVGGTCGSPLLPSHGARNARYAQAPVRCVAPQLLEGEMRFDLAVGNFRKSIMIMKFAYDAYNERKRIELHSMDMPKNISDSLFLYKQKMIYSFDRATGTCTKMNMPSGDSFERIDVPSDAIYAGRFYDHLTSSYVDVWNYRGVSPLAGVHGVSQQGMANITATWRADGSCLPVSMTAVDLTSKAIVSASVNKLSLGIKDPSVFRAPQGCRWQQ